VGSVHHDRDGGSCLNVPTGAGHRDGVAALGCARIGGVGGVRLCTAAPDCPTGHGNQEQQAQQRFISALADGQAEEEERRKDAASAEGEDALERIVESHGVAGRAGCAGRSCGVNGERGRYGCCACNRRGRGD